MKVNNRKMTNHPPSPRKTKVEVKRALKKEVQTTYHYIIKIQYY